MIPYTICFCTSDELVLMLYRTYPPNAGLWNGLGGRIEPGETPEECVRREVFEEAGVDLRAEALRYAGVVIWPEGVDPTTPSTGMHAFVADLGGGWPVWEGDRPTDEGLLAWKPLGWILDPGNADVVSNIPRFLPGLLDSSEPMEYRCEYAGVKLVDIAVQPM